METLAKNIALKKLADLINKNRKEILNANKDDIRLCENIDISLMDRLKIDDKKIDSMIDSIDKVWTMNDPENKVLYEYRHDNGMIVKNKSVPFGKILIIYESRPDVTIEASILAFKAGNEVLLKGGKEAHKSNEILVRLWQEALKFAGLSGEEVRYLSVSREEIQNIIKNNTLGIDMIIPRGGQGLINFVKNNSTVPIIVSGRGNNFAFIDKDADFRIATSIIINGKSRISVCNALDKVLIDKNSDNLNEKIKNLVDKLIKNNIEILGCNDICKIDSRVKLASCSDVLDEEFLSARIYLSLVDNIDKAISIINNHSGGHSATIISTDVKNAEKFQDNVDCAAVYHNVSTRFTDGGQFGFGAEIAISTQKLHFRGPIGLNQLVTNKWYIYGNGQIRE